MASRYLILLAIIFSSSLFFSVSGKKIPTSRPQMIEAICKTVTHVKGCRRTITNNPGATASKDLISMARAVIGIAATHAQETLDFINNTIKIDPTVKTMFEQCAQHYNHILFSLKGAAGDELKEAPMSSDYMVMRTFDDTRMTMDVLAGKGGASVNALKEKTHRMDGFIWLAMGGINAVGKFYGEQ